MKQITHPTIASTKLKVLITGSNGFVGGALASALMQGGHHVTGLGRSHSSRTSCHAYICHDLSLPLPAHFADKFDVVVHAAALASPWASPEQYLKNNVDATHSILQFCRENNTPHFIYISSSSIFYTRKDQFDLSEDSLIPELQHQINEYSKTKLLGEWATKNYQGTFAILRPRAIFGRGDTVLLPRIIEAAKKNRLPLLYRTDGKKTFGDLIAIETLTAYLVQAVEKRYTGEFNLTNAEPIAINDFVAEVLQQLNISWSRRKIPVALAYASALGAEFLSKYFQNYREPAVTRFGVSVFAASKTFNVARMLSQFGPPKQSVADAVRDLVQWYRSENPS